MSWKCTVINETASLCQEVIEQTPELICSTPAEVISAIFIVAMLVGMLGFLWGSVL
jgi:hypothetical protein